MAPGDRPSMWVGVTAWDPPPQLGPEAMTETHPQIARHSETQADEHKSCPAPFLHLGGDICDILWHREPEGACPT